MNEAIITKHVENLRGYIAAAEAERDAARAQLAAFVPPGALSAGEIPALCGICKELSCVPGLPGCARCMKAELARLRRELAAYHAAAESTDLEGDVADHLADLADWQTENSTAPDWLVDAVIGLIAPVKAERDRLAEQVKRARARAQEEADALSRFAQNAFSSGAPYARTLKRGADALRDVVRDLDGTEATP